MTSREDLKIESSTNKLRIAVSIYSDTNLRGPRPVLVMGHGIGAVKDVALEPFATAFAAQGYFAVTFDYLYFGQSEGKPRNLLSVPQELQDFKDVIAWVRQQPDRFDIDRIVAWGTSFGGMHSTALMAQDHQLVAGIAQCPCVDGFGAAMMATPWNSFRMTMTAMHDWLRSWFSEEPVYMGLTSDGSRLAIMMGPEAVDGWERITTDKTAYFPNMITGRSLFSVLVNRPLLGLHKSVKPYLFVLPKYDNQVPLPAAEDAVRRAPLGEELRVEGGHFDLYKGGPSFDKNLKGQLEFLKRVLG